VKDIQFQTSFFCANDSKEEYLYQQRYSIQVEIKCRVNYLQINDHSCQLIS